MSGGLPFDPEQVAKLARTDQEPPSASPDDPGFDPDNLRYEPVDPADNVIPIRADVQRPQAPKREILSAQLDLAGPQNIPPRQWAYGHFLLFGSAAVIGAVDGGGKGTIVTAIMLAMITGEPILGEKVWRNGPVAIITYEDDETEWHRRLAAACLHYNLPYYETLRHVHFIRCSEGRVVFARSADGRMTMPDGDGVADMVRQIGAVLLVIDPFNHSHDCEDGNSNASIAKVAGEMSRVARETNAAILVLHHLRKGSTGAADDLMGATALRATFRSCRILARMDGDTAKKMNIQDPWRYIRVAGSKENYAPPPEKLTWFRLQSVMLGNASDTYPEGDSIGVATIWQARPMFEGMDGDTLADVFRELRSSVHGPVKQSRSVKWAGVPLVDVGGRSEREAVKIIEQWEQHGVLVREEHKTESRNKVLRYVLDEAKVTQILNDLTQSAVDIE